MVLRQRSLRPCGQNTRSAWSESLPRPGVLFGECSRRGGRKRYQIRRLRGPGQCRANQRYPSRRRGRIDWLYMSIDAEFNMKHVLPSICSVNSYFVDLCCVFTEILDVSEDMAAAILTDEVAQICS